MNMDTTTHSQENTLKNLLVVDNSGRILSRRVSQTYGTVLLRAIARSVNLRTVHRTSLLQHEPWTLENIKEDAQSISPGHNIIFVDEKRRILSCRVNPDYGKALLESLPQEPTEVADDAEAALSYDTTIQSGEASSSKQDPSFPLFNTSATPTANARILSDQILSALNRQPYDRDWMRKYNINDSCLNGPSSQMKLDVLLKNGAIKAGDLLCVRYELDEGSPDLEVGQVLQPRQDPHNPHHSRLDLQVLTQQAGMDVILYDLKDATGIINGLVKESQNTDDRSEKLSEPWKIVGVYEEDGKEVGTLWKVRQAYEVFTQAITDWGERNNEMSE